MTDKDYSTTDVPIRLWDGEIISVNLDTLAHYSNCCATCRWFRAAFVRQKREDIVGMWVDDEGWCVAHPPVFVGGKKKEAEYCDVARFAQPGVVGSDECGEYVKGWEFHGNMP